MTKSMLEIKTECDRLVSLSNEYRNLANKMKHETKILEGSLLIFGQILNASQKEYLTRRIKNSLELSKSYLETSENLQKEFVELWESSKPFYLG